MCVCVSAVCVRAPESVRGGRIYTNNDKEKLSNNTLTIYTSYKHVKDLISMYINK